MFYNKNEDEDNVDYQIYLSKTMIHKFECFML